MDIKDSYLHGTVGVVKSISVNADKLTYNLADVGNTARTVTLPLATTSANGLLSSTDKAKLDAATGVSQAIPYIVGSTTDTAGVWTGSHTGIIAYSDGLTIIYVPKVAGSSNGTTLNINGLGATECHYTGSSKMTTHYSINTPILLTYVGGYWKRADYESWTPYVAAYCSTAAATAAKTASCSSYILTPKTYVHMLITNANTAQSALTMNINSKGAKPIYINGAASSSSNYTLPAGTYIVYYDGTNFYFRTDGVLPGKIETAQLSDLVTCTAGSSDVYRPIVVYTSNTGKVYHNAKVTANYGSGDLKATSFTGTLKGTADKVANNLILKINSGSTEGTSLYTYNGSAAKTLDIKNGTGIGFTNTAGVLSIYNSGVRSISTGTANGTISVNTNGTSANVAVKGLGSAAYTNSSAYAVRQTLSTEDLNNVITPGFYNCGGGNTCTNKPEGVDHFGMYVIHCAGGTYYVQILFEESDSTRQWRRHCLAGAWSSWTLDKLSDTTYSVFTGATASADGTYGLVPKPTAGNQGKFLKADGTWAAPTNTTYNVVSNSANGLAPKVINTNTATVGTAYYVLASSDGSATPSWYKLPANAFVNDDTKVTQTNTTTSASYRVLLSGNANDTTETTTARKSANLLFNPNSNTLSAGTILATNSIVITNTNNAKHILFSRGANTTYQYNYIAAPEGGYICILPNGAKNSSTSGMQFTGEGLRPATNAAYSLGTTSLKWNNVYANTFVGSLTGNATTATKLATKRKLWGLDFDGSADVSGSLSDVTNITSQNSAPLVLRTPAESNKFIYLRYNSNDNTSVCLTGNGFMPSSASSNKLTLGASGNKWSTVYATTFIGNLDGTYVNKLTGYSKATSASDIAAADTLNSALGKLEYKAHYAYDWVIGVTATDTDEYINKWSEIVGFLDSVKEGTDILDEFVTRKTAQTITGTKTFSKVINSANSGGSWVSGMTNASIKYDSLNALNASNYHPIIGVKTNGENVVNLGAYVNDVGFYGYKKGRTDNSYDWLFKFNSETGAITHTGPSITANKFITSGGTSSKFVKGDGSLDSTTYAAASALSNYLPLTGGTLSGSLYFSGTNHIIWNSGSYWQRLFVTDDAIAGTEVFTFQQSSDKGTTWSNLCHIKDDGSVVASSFIKSGGTSSLFLKADGSVDSNTYATTTLLGNYLPLTGGTLTGPLTIDKNQFGSLIIYRNGSTNSASILFKNGSNVSLGYVGMNTSNGNLFRFSADSSTSYKIWDSGIDGSGSGLDADLLDGIHASGLFTALSNVNTTDNPYSISATIGGTTKHLKVNYATNSFKMVVEDIRNTTPTPDDASDRSVTAWFNNKDKPGDIYWYSGITVAGWVNDYRAWQLASSSHQSDDETHLHFRTGRASTWETWRTVLDSSNYTTWVNTTNFPGLNKTGTVTSIKVGNTSYSPSSGVVSLPAYPTSLKNPNAIKFKNTAGTAVSYDGSAAVDLTGGVNYATDATNLLIYKGLASSVYTTVKAMKDQLKVEFGNVKLCVGSAINIPHQTISNWDNESFAYNSGGTYTAIKLSGGYSGNTYGLWLLSAFGDERLYYVGLYNGEWTTLRKIAITSDIPTSLKNPHTLTFAAGTFAAKTYDGSAAVTVNVPTKTSHLTNDSGFLTSRGYIGTTAVQASSAAQNLTGIGNLTMSGNLTITPGNTDNFITFSYSSGTTYSWRLGYLGTGSGDGNYLVIQSAKAAGTSWNNVIRMGNETLDAAFGGNVYPITTNAQTLGTSTYKWANVYSVLGNFSGALTLSGTAADTAAINFSRASYNYIHAPASGLICIQPNAMGATSNAGYQFTGTDFRPGASNTYTLGTSSNIWKNVYATTFTGNLTGNVTGNVSGSSGSCTGNAATATTLKPTTVVSAKAFNLSNTAWTDTGYTFASLATGTYAIQVTSGTNLVASGIMSVYKNLSDSIGDEIPLHVYGTTVWRPYLRTHANKLLISSNDASATSRTVTIKIAQIL